MRLTNRQTIANFSMRCAVMTSSYKNSFSFFFSLVVVIVVSSFSSTSLPLTQYHTLHCCVAVDAYLLRKPNSKSLTAWNWKMNFSTSEFKCNAYTYVYIYSISFTYRCKLIGFLLMYSLSHVHGKMVFNAFSGCKRKWTKIKLWKTISCGNVLWTCVCVCVFEKSGTDVENWYQSLVERSMRFRHRSVLMSFECYVAKGNLDLNGNITRNGTLS